MSPVIEGRVAPGFEPLRAAFEAAFADAPTMGAALAIRVGGEEVVNLWGGLADERKGTLWQENTASVIFSCTKGLMGLLVARLVAEGRLDYTAPVARYWPEFAAAGKAEVKVSQLMSHSAGLSGWKEKIGKSDLYDWEKATSLLAGIMPVSSGRPCRRRRNDE